MRKNPAPAHLRKNHIIAYLCPTTSEVVLIEPTDYDADRACEALRGQGITQMGMWHRDDWSSWGKRISDKWRT